MAGVQFYKYSAYGNTFVIVDEVKERSLEDQQMSSLAPVATDEHGGIGADNLLVVQRFSPALMREIQASRGYWSSDPCPALEAEAPDYVFRMFEPDGSEALCCGNGLLCVAKHMSRVHQVERCRMLTEVPAERPRVREIATRTDDADFQYEVRIGRPSRMPTPLMEARAETACGETVGSLVPIRLQRPITGSLPSELVVEGYVTYTGEPHMVIIERGMSSEDLRQVFTRIMGADRTQEHIDLGLLNELGLALNEQARGLFPKGINISFARLTESEGLVEYRCFERGVFKETLACGTAAVAVATVFRELGMFGRDSLTFWPRRSRGNIFYTNARIQVSRDPDGSYWLRGQAKRIYEATLRMSEYPEVLRPSERLLANALFSPPLSPALSQGEREKK